MAGPVVIDVPTAVVAGWGALDGEGLPDDGRAAQPALGPAAKRVVARGGRASNAAGVVQDLLHAQPERIVDDLRRGSFDLNPVLGWPLDRPPLLAPWRSGGHPLRPA